MRMPRPISTLSTLLCASLLLAGAVRDAAACAWNPTEVAEAAFFDPGVIGRPAEEPFFYDPYYRYYRDMDVDVQKQLAQLNTREWGEYFGPRLSNDAWSALLYGAPLTRLDHVIFALQGKAKPADDDAPFMNYPDRPKLVAALYYVGFAKRVEPLATLGAVTWDAPAPPPDTEKIKTLLTGGARALDSVKDPFLRERYAFQLVRLHFYGRDWEQTIHAWNEHAAEFADDGSPRWRALGYVAGAYYKLHRFADANLAYAKVFDGFAALRGPALWSFHPQEEKDWRDALNRAGTVRAKTVLWQMLGITSDGPRAMREIHALDPLSDLLPLLLVREVNLVEVRRGFSPDELFEARDPRDTKVESAARSFIEERAGKGDVAEPWLWELAAAHLHAIEGDLAGSTKLLDRADKHAPKSPLVDRQLRLTRLLARIAALRTVDGSAEPYLARELTWVRDLAKDGDPKNGGDVRMKAFLDRANERLGGLYAKSGNHVLAVCLHDGESPLYAKAESIDALTRFLDRKDTSAFEAYAASLYTTPRTELAEIKALVALYDGDIATAAQRIAPLQTATLGADPFVARINDCHDCDATDPKHSVYTKTSFVLRLDALRREAESNPKVAAKNWFDIATALYNITCYGNASDMYEGVMPQFTPRRFCNGKAWGRRCSLPGQMERALEYYRKAHDAATDREFKARAAFMAAKCEQNIFFNRKPEDGGTDFVAGEWFHKLHGAYADTKYHAEVLKECGYFRTYASK